MKSSPLPAAVSAFGLLCCTASAATTAVPLRVLYDVNFNADSGAIRLGAAPDAAGIYRTPSQQNFGFTTSLSSYGPLTDRPAMMTANAGGAFQYSQLQFNTQSFFDSLPSAQTRQVEFRFDLLLDRMGGNSVPVTDGKGDIFTLLIDSPDSHRLDFGAGGGLWFGNTQTTQIGTYTPGVVHHYSVINYLDENRIEVWRDGTMVHSGTFHKPYPAAPNPPTSIRSYRLNLTDGTTVAGSPVAALDNVSIRFIPEPSSALLAAAALAFGIASRRRLQNDRAS